MYMDSLGNLILVLLKVVCITINFVLNMFYRLGIVITSSISLNWLYIQ